MINSVIICGNLCKDPEIKVTESGKKWATFSIAVNNGKRNGQELPPDYFNCQVWEKTAEFVESYAKKGMKATINGHLKTRVYENQYGKQYSVYILVQDVELMSGKREEPNKDTQSSVYEPSREAYYQPTITGGNRGVTGGLETDNKPFYAEIKEDDLPFY